MEFLIVHAELLLGAYFLSVFAWMYALLVSASKQIAASANPDYERPTLDSSLWPSVSVLIPAYNEQLVLPNTLTDFLQNILPNYPGDLEIVIADDGSTDNTAGVCKSLTELSPCIKVVLRESNGGRAAALNSALAVATGKYVISTDADTVLELDGLLKIIPMMEADPTLHSVGGTILLSNHKKAVGSKLVSKVGNNLIVGTQIVEYIRSFVYGRMGLNNLGGNLIVSGAFGVFRRDKVEELGRWDEEALAEDLDMTVRIRAAGGKVKFIPEPVAWTEAPSDLKSLGNQRDRWYRGLTQSLGKWRKLMVTSPRQLVDRHLAYCTLPIYAYTEWLSPIVQIFGLWLITLHVLFGSFNWPLVALIGAGAYLLSVGTSLWAIFLEQKHFRRYVYRRDTAKLVLFALLEPFWYNPLHVMWRIKGLLKYLMTGDTQWGAMKRTGTKIALLLALLFTPTATEAQAQWVEGNVHVEAQAKPRVDMSVIGWLEPITLEYRQVLHNDAWDDQVRAGLLFSWAKNLDLEGSFGYSPNVKTRILPTMAFEAGLHWVTGPFVWNPSFKSLVYRGDPSNYLEYVSLTQFQGKVSWYRNDDRIDALLGSVYEEDVYWGGVKFYRPFENYAVDVYGYLGQEILDFPVMVASSKSLGGNVWKEVLENFTARVGIGVGERNDVKYLSLSTGLRYSF